MTFSLLPTTYFPSHQENRMTGEGDVSRAREFFLEQRPSNLTFLLKQRYDWMNPYLTDKEVVIELGSGAGFSKSFLKNPHIKMTDVSNHPWIEMYVDALELPFESNSVDVIICSHMIHHLAHPKKFFKGVHRVLKPGGIVLISEINTSLMMRVLLRLMRHEGWSYNVNVFDENLVSNDPSDPWSANCAIPELLFRDSKQFEKNIDGFKVTRNELTECLIFPISGGVIAKTPTINLPFGILNLVYLLDRLLIRMMPRIFALGKRVVLQKSNSAT